MNGGPPPLSFALVKHVAVNNTVIVTWSNSALLDFTLNWVAHIQKLGAGGGEPQPPWVLRPKPPKPSNPSGP